MTLFEWSIAVVGWDGESADSIYGLLAMEQTLHVFLLLVQSPSLFHHLLGRGNHVLIYGHVKG